MVLPNESVLLAYATLSVKSGFFSVLTLYRAQINLALCIYKTRAKLIYSNEVFILYI